MSTTDLPGSSLLAGRYRLVERLGAGGMSVVWRGFDEVLGRQVAVKLLPPSTSADPTFRRRLRAEAQAAARLSHPHITNVYDYGEATTVDGEAVPYVVMELVDGESLAAVLGRERQLPWTAAVRVCAQVAAALAAAHARGIVHRDVTPANVMLTSSGAKVVDFGISALIGENDIDPDGSLMGTPAYLAPERLVGGQVSPATDVYAVGLLIYRTLIGQLPWDVGTTTALLRAHQYTEPDPMPDVDGLPPAVAALVARCLEKRPDDRPSSAEAAHVLAGISTGDPAGLAYVAAWLDSGEDTTILPSQLNTDVIARVQPGHVRFAAAAAVPGSAPVPARAAGASPNAVRGAAAPDGMASSDGPRHAAVGRAVPAQRSAGSPQGTAGESIDEAPQGLPSRARGGAHAAASSAASGAALSASSAASGAGLSVSGTGLSASNAAVVAAGPVAGRRPGALPGGEALPAAVGAGSPMRRSPLGGIGPDERGLAHDVSDLDAGPRDTAGQRYQDPSFRGGAPVAPGPVAPGVAAHAGPFAAGPFAAGSSAAGSSAAGPPAGGLSMDGPSAAGPSVARPSAAGPRNSRFASPVRPANSPAGPVTSPPGTAHPHDGRASSAPGTADSAVSQAGPVVSPAGAAVSPAGSPVAPAGSPLSPAGSPLSPAGSLVAPAGSPVSRAGSAASQAGSGASAPVAPVTAIRSATGSPDRVSAGRDVRSGSESRPGAAPSRSAAFPMASPPGGQPPKRPGTRTGGAPGPAGSPRRRLLIVLGAVLAIGAAGYAVSVAGAGRDGASTAEGDQVVVQQGPRKCIVTYSVRSDTGKTFQAGLTITNLAAVPVSDWVLHFVMPGDQTVSTIGKLKPQQEQHDVVVRSTRPIRPNSTAVLDVTGGYQASNAVPVAFSLKGETCDVFVSGKPGDPSRPVQRLVGGGTRLGPVPPAGVVLPGLTASPGGVINTVPTGVTVSPSASRTSPPAPDPGNVPTSASAATSSSPAVSPPPDLPNNGPSSPAPEVSTSEPTTEDEGGVVIVPPGPLPEFPPR